MQIRLNDFFFFLIFKCTISNKEEYKIKIPLNFQSYLQFYATNRFNKPIFKFPLSFTDLWMYFLILPLAEKEMLFA